MRRKARPDALSRYPRPFPVANRIYVLQKVEFSMNTKKLLEQFLGPDALANLGVNTRRDARRRRIRVAPMPAEDLLAEVVPSCASPPPPTCPPSDRLDGNAADGHIDADEQKQIFDAAGRGDLMPKARRSFSTRCRTRCRPTGSRPWPAIRSRRPNSTSPRAWPSIPTTRTSGFLATLATALKLPDGLAEHLASRTKPRILTKPLPELSIR